MKRSAMFLCIAVVVLSVRPANVLGEKVSLPEARAVAEHWLRSVSEKDGAWGGAGSARLIDVAEIRREGRLLGYLARVDPRGSIVVSPLKELPPVRAYSVRTDFDMNSEIGPDAMLRMCLERTVRGIEKVKGPLDALEKEDLGRLVERPHREDWDRLLRGLPLDYAEGAILLTSTWGQSDPYNELCPPLGCGYPYDGRAPVGCVATAASQIMRYWSWPPYGQGEPYNIAYDWPNMPDVLTSGCPSEEIAATSELCKKIGVAAGTDYDCDGSSAWMGDAIGADMTDAYKDHFRYHDNVDFEMRWHWTTGSWYEMIKDELNANRPLQYAFFGADWGGFAGHSMACDGWLEVGSDRYVHMNYGWSGSWDNFYEIDDLHNVGWGDWEGIIRKIKPEVAEGPAIEDGVHDPASSPFAPYGYFDQNASGDNVVFDAGYRLQFLAGVRVTCVSATGGVIDFRGTPSAPTYLFSGGDLSRGALIGSGALRLHNGGGIRLD